MTSTITADQMRALEKTAMGSGQVTGLALMERAGQGVLEAIFDAWPDLAAPSRAVILCGPGNNGGDGFVVARLLAACDWEVDVFFYGHADKLPLDARRNYDRWQALGRIHSLGFPTATPKACQTFAAATLARTKLDRQPDTQVIVLIDALFGLGLNRPVVGLNDIFGHWDHLASSRALNKTRLVAIDQPSGLDTDTGAELRGDPPFPALFADLTVTFHKPKPVHRLAAHICGKTVVKDIGL